MMQELLFEVLLEILILTKQLLVVAFKIGAEFSEGLYESVKPFGILQVF